MVNSVFWLFKKEILRMANVKTILPIERFCFEFIGDTGNAGEIIYLDDVGDQQIISGVYNFMQVITVSASSIVSYSGTFNPTGC